MSEQIEAQALSQHISLNLKQYALLTLQGLRMEVENNHKCWFCSLSDKDLIFEPEFDAYVHIDCVRTALNEDPLHPEANLMKYLFKPL